LDLNCVVAFHEEVFGKDEKADVGGEVLDESQEADEEGVGVGIVAPGGFDVEAVDEGEVVPEVDKSGHCIWAYTFG